MCVWWWWWCDDEETVKEMKTLTQILSNGQVVVVVVIGRSSSCLKSIRQKMAPMEGGRSRASSDSFSLLVSDSNASW